MIITIALTLCCILWASAISAGTAGDNYVTSRWTEGVFTLADSGKTAPLCASTDDYAGVLRVLNHLQTDIERVTDAKPTIFTDALPQEKEIVIIGTLGKNQWIDDLLSDNKLDVEEIMGKWESFCIQTITEPFPGVDRALIIVGSDKRGTIYGMFDLSEKIGVSPWYWWADVPAKKKASVFIKPGYYSLGEPKVKYRGIFINDEAPALSGWAYEKFGGFNSQFYQHVFELILRMKGNFLWPAMWGRAFYVDDPENPRLADEYGIVISTSHHEPMMRAHAEWAQFGSGPWNYEANEARLRDFWTEGIERMGDYESIITLAMRGDGDEPMSEEANIELLQRIVNDQREIITEVTGKDITTIPQVWALYKEVQEYYDRGMRVPDDVTLLLCDDNWGNLRKLPKLDDKARSGGYGIYYHYDYVGGPRNYKWLNTNQIARVWEQMHLAYEYGVKEIWIVNVGDIKPMEFPIEFFLDYAWDPELFPAEHLPAYTHNWAAEQFGSSYAAEISDIITKYTTYNSRRKPELLSPDTYSLINYREAETIVADCSTLKEKAKTIYNALPSEYHEAFYQLVLHPVEACANLNELYVTVAKNRLYSEQGRVVTNRLADEARKLFDKDAEITHYYNTIMADGKWNHMMDQTHIGYTYWQQPDVNAMPEVDEIKIHKAADMGVAIEGTRHWWPSETSEAVLPEFDRFNQQTYFIELFNRGGTPFKYRIIPKESWIVISQPGGEIETEKRLWVSVDWDNVPSGEHRVPITIKGAGKSDVIVMAPVKNPVLELADLEDRFIESNGYISIEAAHYMRAVNSESITWQNIPNLGRTLSAMTPFPVTAEPQAPVVDSARLEYELYLFNQGDVSVQAYLSPTLNFHNNQGLRYGISLDDEPVQIINMHTDKTFQDWEESVRNNGTTETSKHHLAKPGKHVLKFWAVDPGIVLQKLVIETRGVKPSYLGPPESYRVEFKPGRSDQ
ncbi:glycosyl hydrolase 115 family protein [candidate division KSB1 bacterium]|nr:glycosyl hydrolase 115 family protein [candidate division KSB1 bacterium]